MRIDGVGREVDARALDLAEVELADAARVHERHLDVESAVGVAQRLDRLGVGEAAARRSPGSMRRARVAVAERAGESPVAGLGDERRGLAALSAGNSHVYERVVQVRQAVVAEADALAELVGDRLVADLVVDDARPLPDAEEPGERHELGGKVDGQLDHRHVSV